MYPSNFDADADGASCNAVAADIDDYLSPFFYKGRDESRERRPNKIRVGLFSGGDWKIGKHYYVASLDGCLSGSFNVDHSTTQQLFDFMVTTTTLMTAKL